MLSLLRNWLHYYTRIRSAILLNKIVAFAELLFRSAKRGFDSLNSHRKDETTILVGKTRMSVSVYEKLAEKLFELIKATVSSTASVMSDFS